MEVGRLCPKIWSGTNRVTAMLVPNGPEIPSMHCYRKGRSVCVIPILLRVACSSENSPKAQGAVSAKGSSWPNNHNQSAPPAFFGSAEEVRPRAMSHRPANPAPPPLFASGLGLAEAEAFCLRHKRPRPDLQSYGAGVSTDSPLPSQGRTINGRRVAPSPRGSSRIQWSKS